MGGSVSSLVDVQSLETRLIRVVPGDPDACYVVRKLEGRTGIVRSRMPQGGPFLSDTAMAIVRA